MNLRVKYENGVLRPLKKVSLKSGEVLEITIKDEDFHVLAQKGGAFDFLNDEDDLYTEADIVESYA